MSDQHEVRVSEPDEHTPLTRHDILIRALMLAILATNSRKKGAALILAMTHIMADEDAASAIFPIRPATNSASQAKALHDAVALYRTILPTLLAQVRQG